MVRGRIAAAAATALVLTVGALGALGPSAAAAPVLASNSKSTITFSANPALLSGPGGTVIFTVMVTVRDSSDVAIVGDSVSLTSSAIFTAPPAFTSPETTNISGVASFIFSCPAGYCYVGDTIPFSATDAGDLSLGPVYESIAAPTSVTLDVTPSTLPGGGRRRRLQPERLCLGWCCPLRLRRLDGDAPHGTEP